MTRDDILINTTGGLLTKASYCASPPLSPPSSPLLSVRPSSKPCPAGTALTRSGCAT
jgi:hypothetical protein